ncbi:MAG: hypothetical protein ABI634_19225 [Acidobacteriota bacterium]
MADSKRIDPQVAGPEARDSRAEALLVEGLDRYFQGRYDDAIHLWTRVLFLDRTHARARAYIDRARTALAERQRRADEMLHTTDDLVARGEVAEARRQLTQAVAMAGEDERVAALRTRLDRLERATVGVGRAGARPAAVVDVLPVGRWKRRVAAVAALLAAGAVGGLLVMLVMSPALHEWLRARSGTPLAVPAAAQLPLPVLSPGDVAMVRARTLYARGRLAEALAALDRIDANGSSRADADQLRTEIQTLLLGSRSRPQSTSTPRSTAVRP